MNIRPISKINPKNGRVFNRKGDINIFLRSLIRKKNFMIANLKKLYCYCSKCSNYNTLASFFENYYDSL